MRAAAAWNIQKLRSFVDYVGALCTTTLNVEEL